MEPIDFIFANGMKDTKLGLTYLFTSFGLDIHKFKEGNVEGFYAQSKQPDEPIPDEIQEIFSEELEVAFVNKERTRFIIASLTRRAFYLVSVSPEDDTSKMQEITYGDIMSAMAQVDKNQKSLELRMMQDGATIDEIWKNTVN
jgi:hypothetical protein